MRWVFVVASVEAAAAGLVLIVFPSLFARLLFGAELSAGGVALGRFAGVALIMIALAAWPSQTTSRSGTTIVRALVVYNVLATLYLAYVGIAGGLTGILLWPAAALHAVFAALFIRTAFLG